VDKILLNRQAGFDHHLVKPVDIDALIELASRGRPLTPTNRESIAGAEP
jgi:hypothetical protein